MSRTSVFAERFADAEVGAALREHREDRAVLLSSLTASLEDDPRARMAWLWGSLGRGDADDLSDLDPWLLVAEDTIGAMGPSLRLYAQQTGNFISGCEAPHNAPPGGGYFSSLHEGRHGLLHVDCYWQPTSAAPESPQQAVLFNRLSEPLTQAFPTPSSVHVTTETEEQGRITRGIGFAWLMLSIAAKYLARDPESDMGLMMYPRLALQEAALLLAPSDFIGPADWEVPANPLDKVDRLRRLVDKTARLTEVAAGRGLDISLLNAVCLGRYLDMVGSIVKYAIIPSARRVR